MNATLVRMLSTNALTAFTAANTTAPVQKTREIRLVLPQTTPAATQATRQAVPTQPPAVAPPRGTLLNIFV